MTKRKVYTRIEDLPVKEVERAGKKTVKVEAPAEEHVNDPAYIERRVDRANKNRPEHIK